MVTHALETCTSNLHKGGTHSRIWYKFLVLHYIRCRIMVP